MSSSCPQRCRGSWPRSSGPRDRAEAGFAGATVALGFFLLLEAALYASNGSSRFQERYLIALAPLAAPAFLLALRRGRSLRVPTALLAGGTLVYIVRVPVSGYTYGSGAQDSPFLRSIFWLENTTGSYGNGSLVLAASASILAVVAAVLAFRPHRAAPIALGLTVAALGIASYASITDDHQGSARTRATYLAAGATWIDDEHLGPVAFLAPEGTQRGLMAEYLFSNSSLRRILLLPGAPTPDAFAVELTSIARDGTIHANGKIVRSPLVVGENYATATLTGATRVRTTLLSTLWRPNGTPRMSMLAVAATTTAGSQATAASSSGPIARAGCAASSGCISPSRTAHGPHQDPPHTRRASTASCWSNAGPNAVAIPVNGARAVDGTPPCASPLVPPDGRAVQPSAARRFSCALRPSSRRPSADRTVR